MQHRFTLHASVAMRWRERTLPLSDAARRLLPGEPDGQDVRLYSANAIEQHVLEALIAEWRVWPVDTFVAANVFDGVSSQLAWLERLGVLHREPPPISLKQAFVTAASFDLSLSDALALSVSFARLAPQLVADAAVHQRLIDYVRDLGLLPWPIWLGDLR